MNKKKDCENCKHINVDIHQQPCWDCVTDDKIWSKWKKE